MKVLNLFSQRSLHLIHLLPFLCHKVAANTEIITFSSSREPTVDLPVGVVGNWSTLHPTDNERRWSVEPAALHTPLYQVCEQTEEDAVVSHRHPPFSCPHELWLFLDLDDEKWAYYSTFTLRLSWAASTPADFTISLYSPKDLLALLAERGLVASASASTSPRTSSTSQPPTTRSKYARIRTVHAGVPVPTTPPYPPFQPHPSSIDADTPPDLAVQQRDREASIVPFIVILEPVCWGVLPASLLPTVWFLVPIILAAIAFVPGVTAYLEPFARQARIDLKAGTRMTQTSADKQR